MSSLEKRVAELEEELKEKNQQVKEVISKLKFLTVGYILSAPRPVEDAPKDGSRVMFVYPNGSASVERFDPSVMVWRDSTSAAGLGPSTAVFFQTLVSANDDDDDTDTDATTDTSDSD